MTLRSSDLQSDSDLDSIRNSCDVWYTEVGGDRTGGVEIDNRILNFEFFCFFFVCFMLMCSLFLC